MQGLLFSYSCPASHSCCSNSWLPTRFLQLSPGWHICFKSGSPSSLIPRYVPARALRSSSSLSICVPPRKNIMATSKSFSSVASNIWNALPIIIANSIQFNNCQIICRLFQLFLLSEAQCITLRDKAPTTAI